MQFFPLWVASKFSDFPQEETTTTREEVPDTLTHCDTTTQRIRRVEISEKVVIPAALSGGATTKSQNPSVPYTPEEFAEEAYKAYKSGAAIVHIHAGDVEMDGLPTADMNKIPPTIEVIREPSKDSD